MPTSEIPPTPRRPALTIPSWFHDTVRPWLDRLGLLVFVLCALRWLALVLLDGCQYPPALYTRNVLKELSTGVERRWLESPQALAPFVGTRSVAEWIGPRDEWLARAKDGWGRPFVVRSLASPWQLELRSPGKDGELDTPDDQYLWLDEDRDTFHEDQLQRATLEAAARRLVLPHSDDCRVQVVTWRDEPKNIPCDVLLPPIVGGPAYPGPSSPR